MTKPQSTTQPAPMPAVPTPPVQPQQQVEKGMSGWAIAAIVFTILTVLCCGCLAIAWFFRGFIDPSLLTDTFTGTVDTYAEDDGTDEPEPEPKPEPEPEPDPDELYDPALVIEADTYFTFTYVGTKPSTEHVNMIKAGLMNHYDELLADFGITSLPKISIEFYTDYSVFSGLSPDTVEEYWTSGMAYYPTEIEFLIDSRSVTEIPYANFEYLAWHEMTHIITYNRFPDGSYYLPDWILEGIAEHEAYKYWGAEYGESVVYPYDPDEVLTTLAEVEAAINDADLDTRGYGYDMAHVFTDYLIETYGWNKIISSMDRVDDASNDYDYAKAFKAATGANLNSAYTSFYESEI